MKRHAILIFTILFIFVGCGGPTTSDRTPAEELPPDMHTSQIALDWAGTYEGVLPCAGRRGKAVQAR